MGGMLNFDNLDFLIGFVIVTLGLLLFNRYNKHSNYIVSINDTFLHNNSDLVSVSSPVSETFDMNTMLSSTSDTFNPYTNSFNTDSVTSLFTK